MEHSPHDLPPQSKPSPSKPKGIRLLALAAVGALCGFGFSTFFVDLMHNLLGPPPREVPVGLTADKYFELGKKYKQVGWTEQSRDSLTRSTKLDPNGVGKSAELFLHAYVPRYPVVEEAVHKNIVGFNQMASGNNDAAITTFKECIKEYPNFEWPYGNLGSVYTRTGKIAEAKDVLTKAVTINPDYVNGWVHLAEANLKDGDYAGARESLSKASAADPESPLVKLLSLELDAKSKK